MSVEVTCSNAGCSRPRKYKNTGYCNPCQAKRNADLRGVVIRNFPCERCGAERLRRRSPGSQKLCMSCAQSDRWGPGHRKTFTCSICAAEFEDFQSRVTGAFVHCSRKCASVGKAQRAEGRHINANGYVVIRVKNKPVLEHRHVMAESLGRPLLRNETVHHVNGQRQDNRLENLELWGGRHGNGQRVVDLVADAVKILELYAPHRLA